MPAALPCTNTPEFWNFPHHALLRLTTVDQREFFIDFRVTVGVGIDDFPFEIPRASPGLGLRTLLGNPSSFALSIGKMKNPFAPVAIPRLTVKRSPIHKVLFADAAASVYRLSSLQVVSSESLGGDHRF